LRGECCRMVFEPLGTEEFTANRLSRVSLEHHA